MTSRIDPWAGRLSLAAALLLACLGLAACHTRTNVSATANVPTQYSHVWVTFRQIGFNTSATAGPADSGWQQFTLPSPQTIDLTAVTDGTLSQFASQLSLPAGTYHEMRVVLSDATDTLASSAQAAQALYNDEVEYTDSGGTVHQVPLEIPNAAQGIGFAIDLTVQTSEKAELAALGCAAGGGSGASLGTAGTFGAIGAFGSSGSTTFGTSTSGLCASLAASTAGSASSVSSTSVTPTCGAGFTYDATTGTCVTSGTTIGTVGASTTGISPTGPQCSAGYVFDSTTGTCVLASGTTGCSFGSTTGSCGSTAFNTAATTSTAIDFDASRDLVPYEASGQSGYLLVPHLAAYDLSHVGTIQGQVGVAALASGTAVEVTAETLSSDGSRHVAVKSAPLRSDGSFVLYPLSTASGSPTQYDLVIHGPGVGSVIIKSVPVSAATPASATSLSLTGIALAGASSFAANVASNSPVSTRGASIGFYQTLPGSGEVPYLIETYAIDPFTGTFDADQSLSAADLAYGTYASSGTTLAAAVPTEGAATYHIAASAPLFGDGALATTIKAPSSGTATFTVAAPSLPSGASAASVAGTVSVATPGRYNKGELLLTHNGALTAVIPLDAYLGAAQSSATLFTAVPGGTSGSTYGNGIYYAEAWVWSSADPSGTLSRQPQTAAIDLSGGSASGVAISIE